MGSSTRFAKAQRGRGWWKRPRGGGGSRPGAARL